MKVLMLVPHGLSAGDLGCYGNEWVNTPALDSLAADGIIFDQHFADHPDPNCVCGFDPLALYHFPSPSLPDALIREGSQGLTSLLKSHAYLALIADSRSTDVEHARMKWERLDVVEVSGDWVATHDEMADRTIRMLNHLSRKGKDDYFVRVDLSTLLPPWHPPEAIDEVSSEDDNLECAEMADLEGESADAASGDDECVSVNGRRYASMISCLDEGLDHIVSRLRKSGLIDDILLIVTCHRGQDLHDVGSYRKWHEPFLHEELVHLPLIVRTPDRTRAGLRISSITQPIDLVPTLMSAFDLPYGEVHGIDLLPLIEDHAPKSRDYACTALQVGNTVTWSVRTPEWCLLRLDLAGETPASGATTPVRTLLFRKPEDRWEVNDVYNQERDAATALEATLADFIAARRSSPMTVPQLRTMINASLTGENREKHEGG
jgi:arylsulfatase A-like enzyme